MTSISRKIISSTIWSAVDGWAREATVFLVFIILARLLGPEAIGLAALAMSAPYILMIPVQHGLPQALVQRQDIEPIHIDSVFWLLLALGAVLTGLIYLSAPLLAWLFDEPVLADLIRVTSLIVALASLSSVPTALLTRQLKFKVFALRTVVSAGFGVVLGLCLALLGYGVWSIVLMYLGRAVVDALVSLVGCGWYPRLRYSHAKCRELFGFAGPVLTNIILAVINTEVPKLVLGIFLGPAAVGVYTIARRPVDLLVNVLVVPVRQVTLPAVVQLRTDAGKISRFLSIGIRCVATISFPSFMGFAAIAPILIPAALGHEWTSAVVPIQILAVYGLLRSIMDICPEIMLALGHAKPYMRMQIINSSLTLVLVAPAAVLSVEAAVAAIVISHLVLLLILLRMMRETTGIDVVPHLKVLPALLFSIAVMVLAVTAWVHLAPGELSGFSQTGVGIMIGVIVFMALASRFLQAELMMLWELLLKGRGKPANAGSFG